MKAASSPSLARQEDELHLGTSFNRWGDNWNSGRVTADCHSRKVSGAQETGYRPDNETFPSGLRVLPGNTLNASEDDPELTAGDTVRGGGQSLRHTDSG